MASHRHLNNAPIREAVIDIRVRLKTVLDKGRVSYFEDSLSQRYPRHEEIRSFEGVFEVKAGKQIGQYAKDKGVSGYLFKSQNEKEIVQFRNNGFTFNKLKPYSSWGEVIKEARDLWELYISNVDWELVTRIAVRYINQMDIPLPINVFEDYLTKPPDVPEGIPNEVSSFLCRVVVHDMSKDIAANISQALEPSVKAGYANIVLDIDVYKNVEIKSDNREQIWVIFEQLHEFKNNIFFNSITERTARLFE